jgi:hypothetical protein
MAELKQPGTILLREPVGGPVSPRNPPTYSDVLEEVKKIIEDAISCMLEAPQDVQSVKVSEIV